ncbi:class A beta-lactamase-related serine hydrolase [bacterium]|nr:class A beta-lactamase-related serine hydrolase [bacterium]
MPQKLSVCCFLLIFGMAQTASVETKIADRMKEFGATTVGIYFEDPEGDVFSLNSNEIFHAASTMKVPVMMEIFRKVEKGKLQLDQPVVVKNEFASIMDGSAYSLTPEEDSDTEIYKLISKTLTLRELVERMINQSSNLATNIVIQMANAKDVMALMKEIGADGMTVLRGVEDIKAYEAGKNNTTSARALAVCMKTILNSKLFSENSREEMFKILLSQTSKTIADGLQADQKGLKVASKDGWITEIHHDAAIIQDKNGKNTILVILTKGVKEEPRGEALVATLAADIWAALH